MVKLSKQSDAKTRNILQNKKFLAIIIILISFFVIGTASSLYMDVLRQTDGEDLRITDALGDSAYAATVTEDTGVVHVVWHDNRTGSYQIFYNKIRADKHIVWPDDLQLTHSPGDAQYPSIAIDSYGNIHAAWQDNRDGNWEIYYKKLDNTGMSVTGDERVTSDPAYSLQPIMKVDSNNDAHITWHDNRTGIYELFWDKRVEPDLNPINISFTPDEPLENENVQINVTAYNHGNNLASDIQVECLIDSLSLENKTINLTAYSNQTVSFNWTAVFGTHEVKIKVDPNNLIAESNEENNIAVEYLTVYRITEFSNSSIWANATVKHSVELQVTIEEVADPNATGTPNNISKFVNFTVDTYFDQALIKIGYTHDDLGEISESTLQMHYWDIYDYQGPQWVLIEDSGVNADENYVWANVSQFSIFAPLGMVELNQPPNTPSTPDGQTPVYAGYDWEYNTSTTDPEGHQIFYKWDWGDEISGWIGPFDSGVMASESHTWTTPGDYNVKVKAKDDPDGDGDPSDGLESDWSDPLLVTVRKPGDANGDSVVNVDDLLLLLASWGELGGPADFNGDGVVDVNDLLILLANWG